MIQGHVVVDGATEGDILLSRQPISFWGGVDPATGLIIDRRHDRCGESVSGRVFAFPEEKGSSTASAVLVELIHNGHAPAAILTCRAAPIVALGAIVAEQLYGTTIPMLKVSAEDFDQLPTQGYVRISAGGVVAIVEGELEPSPRQTPP